MTALKAGDVARFVLRPDIEDGVFLAYGPDGGLVRETVARLIETLGQRAGEIDVVVLDAAQLDAEPGLLAVEAKTGSLFGGKRIVRVRGTGRTLAGALGELGAPEGAAILVEAGALTPRDALRVLVEKAPYGRALPCFADSEQTLGNVIAETLGKAGISADAETQTLLRQSLGNDREITRRELEKLTLYAASTGTLTAEDIAALSPDNALTGIDEVLDAVGGGHAEALDRALGRALANGVDAQRVLALSLLHFVGLRRWRAQVDEGRSPREVLEGVKPRPHFSRMRGLESQLRLWRDPALAAAVARLLETIAQTRRRPGLAEAALRRCLLSLCVQAAHN